MNAALGIAFGIIGPHRTSRFGRLPRHQREQGNLLLR
jgi:hypothetical protein